MAATGSDPQAGMVQGELVNAKFDLGVDRDSVCGFWFKEDVTRDMRTELRMEDIMFKTVSDFQKVQVVRTSTFGKTLVLDGKTQSAERDEFVYHESLVHPAMLLHPHPKRVYIGGGGELATAREVLRHTTVEKCVMVDIDKVVVDVSIDMLPEWGDNCMKDDRLEVHYTDANAFLRAYEGPKFDVIIMDIADPIEAGPGYVLYTKEFYEFATTRLTEGGILVTQSGPGAVHTKGEAFTVINNTLRTAFKHVAPYTVDIPSFGCQWAFNLAFNESSKCKTALDVVSRDVGEVDREIEQRLKGELRFLDGIAHHGIFGTPLWLRKAAREETRVMKVDEPIFMY